MPINTPNSVLQISGKCDMQTIFDWVTMAIFGGLVVLFLQRSTGPQDDRDKIYHYLPPALGCAAANYLGNNDQRVMAIAIVIAVVGYILFVLNPFGRR
jgi:hypothetical protein